MILKASTVSSAGHVGRLAAHLLRTDENDHVGAVEFRGTSERRQLSDALGAMFNTRELMRSDMGLFHVALNPRAADGAAMTPEQWRAALDAVEQRFNLADQARILVPHVKDGRVHLHAVYQVCDVERGRRCHGFNHYKLDCKSLGAEIEQRLELARTPRTPTGQEYSRDAQFQAKAEGWTVTQRRQAIRDAWRQAGSGAEFRDRLRSFGIELARGDKAGAVFVGPTGYPIAAGPELRGTATVKQLAARLAGERLDAADTVKKRQRERLKEAQERARTDAEGDDRPAGREAAPEAKQPARRRAEGQEQADDDQGQAQRRKQRPPTPGPALRYELKGWNPPGAAGAVSHGMPKELRDALHELRIREDNPDHQRRAARAAHEERFREASFIDGHHPDPEKRVPMPGRDSTAGDLPTGNPPDRATQARRPTGRDLDAFAAAAVATLNRRRMPKEPERVTPDRAGRTIEDATAAARAILEARRAQERGSMTMQGSATALFREGAPAQISPPGGPGGRVDQMHRTADDMGIPRLSQAEYDELRAKYGGLQPRERSGWEREIE